MSSFYAKAKAVAEKHKLRERASSGASKFAAAAKEANEKHQITSRAMAGVAKAADAARTADDKYQLSSKAKTGAMSARAKVDGMSAEDKAKVTQVASSGLTLMAAMGSKRAGKTLAAASVASSAISLSQSMQQQPSQQQQQLQSYQHAAPAAGGRSVVSTGLGGLGASLQNVRDMAAASRTAASVADDLGMTPQQAMAYGKQGYALGKKAGLSNANMLKGATMLAKASKR